MTKQRLKELLANAVTLFEYICNGGESLMNTDLEGELNITQDEYDEIKLWRDCNYE